MDAMNKRQPLMQLIFKETFAPSNMEEVENHCMKLI